MTQKRREDTRTKSNYLRRRRVARAKNGEQNGERRAPNGTAAARQRRV
jgi:hypothetical protein